MTAALLTSLERLLLPNSCLICDRFVEKDTPDSLVCAVCCCRLRRVPAGCERCQQPMPPVGPCRFCAEWPAVLGATASAVWLTDEARELVHALKYRGFTQVAETMADSMARYVRRPDADVLAPIALGRRRLRSRGYNQSVLICRKLSQLWRIPSADHLLARTRETKSQTELTADERRDNVARAFVAESPAKPAETRVIVIDDVLTTGATLCAAAAAVSTAGWRDVTAITFARAMPLETKVLLS